MELLQLKKAKTKKRLLWLYALLFLITAVLMAVLWHKSREAQPEPCTRDFADIQAAGVLKVATSYNALDYHVNGDTIEGLQYSLIKQLGQYFGLEVEVYLENDIQQSFEGLTGGAYDIVARNIPVTTELRVHFAFTDPIEFGKQVLIQNRDREARPLRNQLGLAGETLSISANSPVKLRLKNLIEEIGDTIYLNESPYDTEQLVMMVARGEIEYAVGDLETVKLLADRFPEIDYATDITFTQLQSWALRPTSPVLLDSVNMWLKTITK